MAGQLAVSLRARCRDLARCDSTIRSAKNRIQECHQFSRSQDSAHSDTTSTPRLDNRTPRQLPLAMTTGGVPPGPLAGLVRRLCPASHARLARHPRLTRHPRLARHPRLTRRPRLARHRVPADLLALASPRMSADAHTFADPDGAGTQHAPQFAGPRQVNPITRAKGEVLVIAREEADDVTAAPARRG
jgi:hypothetical protein